jgi:NAD(P)H-hydrate epimerase
MKIVSSEQMKKIDEECIGQGTLGLTLMERAGEGFVKILKDKFTNLNKKKVLILVGKGNNGGDGLVIARKLFEAGSKVKVVLLAGVNALSENAKTNFDKANNLGVDFIEYNEKIQDGFREEIEKVDLIVDSIFGTGLKSELPVSMMELFKQVNSSKKFIAACDISSGINGTTGKVANFCISADLTITFGLPKIGLFLFPGRNFTGEVRVVDIGIPSSVIEKVKVRERLLDWHEIEGVVPRRDKKDVYKNNFGHVLVLAGSIGMTGAAALTCQGAIRSGAGLVTLAIAEDLNHIMEVKLTEVMTFPLPAMNRKILPLKSFKKIMDFIEKRNISLLAMGPGLSMDRDMGKLVEKILLNIQIPCVLDADALNLLAEKKEILKETRAKLIITPHPGELARLLGKNTLDIQKERIKWAKEFAAKYNLICLLKGHQTIITDGEMLYLNSTGNPGMASAGMGDVLTGIISGLVAQMMEKINQENSFSVQELLMAAAGAGVYLHGLAGDFASREKGEVSLIASDLLGKIPEVIMNKKN